MRRIVLSIVIFLSFLSIAKADGGVYGSFIIINGHYYQCKGGNNFNGHDFGSFIEGSSLSLKGGELKTWKDGGTDITGAFLYYRIYKEGTAPSNFIEINLPWKENGIDGNGNNQKWAKTDLTINVLSGLSAGNYTIEVYFKATSNQGDKYDTDGGANYKANFKITAPLPASLTITSMPNNLKEDNLNNVAINLTLENETFLDANLEITNFTLQNAPNGLIINSVSYVDSKNAEVTLSFDGTDFDADISNFGLTVNATELTSTSSLSATNLSITALEEKLKLTVPTPLKEDALDNAVVDITLENETFLDANLEITNFTLQNAPNGLTINSVSYVDSKNAKVTLSFDGTDFDTDIYNFGIKVKKEELKQNNTDLNKENLTITAVVEDELIIGGVTIKPSKPTRTEQVTITFDATGTALEDATKVYFHSGVGMDKPNSKQFNKTVGNWDNDDGIGEMTSLGNHKWQIVLSNIDAYYSLENNDDAFGLNFLFRNSDGAEKEDNQGGNYHVEIESGNYFLISKPNYSPYLVEKGVSFSIESNANAPVNWSLDELNSDGTVKIANVNNQQNIQNYTFSHSLNDENVFHYFRLTAGFGGGGITKTKTFEVKTHKAISVAPVPNGAKKGINYNVDGTVTFVLHTPTETTYEYFDEGNCGQTSTATTKKKEVVYLIGDFNDWEADDTYLLNRTEDSDYWHITLTKEQLKNLRVVGAKEAVFQYLVDGEIRIGDPYAHQVSDYDDKYISSSVYSNLISYPEGKTIGRASVVDLEKPTKYAWKVSVFERKKERNELNVYELHFRDFTPEGTYKSATTKLDYLKELGINCIHIMPISEFEGNDSWGYNPNYYFAMDKAYGTPNDLKEFIDEAHLRGMAVVNDLVLNHAFSSNPNLMLYWNKAENRPADDNPWFNPQHKGIYDEGGHWGADWNHGSEHTRQMVDDIINYWMDEFHFDGFRFDFTKGLTQKNPNPSDPWASNYDSCRVEILKRMANTVWSNNSGIGKKPYVIFEHLANDEEDKILADAGILMWSGARTQTPYMEMAMGTKKESFWNSVYESRQFSFANYMSYLESHDEERIGYKVKNWGKNNDGTTKYLINRLKLVATFNMLLPGPRMVWQFGELGYDVSIDENGRTGKKPNAWDLNYDGDAERQQLYRLYSLIFKLRNKCKFYISGGKKPDYANIGSTTDWLRKMRFWAFADKNENLNKDIQIIPVGNFDTENDATITPEYNPNLTGKWFKYNGDPAVDGTPYQVNSSSDTYTLYKDDPVYILTNADLIPPKITSITKNIQTGVNTCYIVPDTSFDFVKETYSPTENPSAGKASDNDEVYLYYTKINDVAITEKTIFSGLEVTGVKSLQGVELKQGKNTIHWVAMDNFGNKTETDQIINVCPTSDLIISEYVEPKKGEKDKLIEIYNGTCEDIDLSQYKLGIYKDGNVADEKLKSLVGTIASGEFKVFSYSDPENYTGMYEKLGSPLRFNGNDPVVLLKNEIVIDMLGTANGNDFAKDITLRRKNSITNPTETYDTDEWVKLTNAENKIYIENIGKRTPLLHATNDDKPICKGTSVTFTANGLGKYEFYINGEKQQDASTTSTFTTTELKNNDKVTVKLKKDTCEYTDEGISIQVEEVVPKITADKTTICPDDEVIFTAEGGTEYEFFVDGEIKQAKSATNIFKTKTLTNEQKIKVKAYNDLGCSDVSEEITINVTEINAKLEVTKQEICPNEEVTFTATGGTEYEFFVNDNSVQKSSENTFVISSLTNKQKIKAIVYKDGCQKETNVITIKVNDLPNNYKSGGFVGKPICQGSEAKLTFKALSKGFTTPYTIKYKVQGSTTEWEQLIEEKGGFEFTVPEKPIVTTVYELVSISNVTCTRTANFGSSTATVEVIVPANAGIDGALTICKGTTPTNDILFNALGGTPDTGGDWTQEGNVYTYTVTAKSPCISDAVSTVIVTEVESVSAGADSILTICEDETPTEEELLKALGGNPTAGGTWTHDGSKHIYTVKGTAPCEDATATVTVKVNDLPNNYKSGGFVGGKICQGSDAKLTFKALSKGFTTPYTITYRVQGSTTEWTQVISEKGGFEFTVPEKPTVTTVYELVSISNVTCTRTANFGSSTVTVEVISPANAGIDGTLTVCKGTTPTDEQLFNALGGTPDTGGTWISNGDVYTYTYTVKAKSPCASDATAKVTVTEVEPVSAGVDSVLTICEGEEPTEEELFKALGGTPTAGGIWTHDGLRHTYTVKGTEPCEDATATVTVKSNDLPNNYKSSGFVGKPICQGSNAKLIFKALSKGFTTPYKITYRVQGSAKKWTQVIDEKGGFEFTVPEKPMTTTTYELVSISNATCTRTADFGTATAEIKVIQPANAGTDGMLTVCRGTTPTNDTLFNALSGSPDTGGAWTQEGNVYTYTVTAKSPCAVTAIATVTVTEIEPVSAGTDATLTICEGQTPTEEKLFQALQGNPTTGGTWTHNGTKHIYTVKGTTPCADETATVTVKVNKYPNNGKTGGFTGMSICRGSDGTLTFDAIDGSFTTPYKIVYKAQGSAKEWKQEIIEKGKVSFTVPVKPTETTAYELVSISNATCTRTTGFGSATATIEVISPANAGTNGTLTICKGTTPTDDELFNALEGTPDRGGDWTHNGTEHIYTVKSKSPCTADATATVRVTEVEPANAGTDVVLPICEGETPTEEELFQALQGNPTTGGTWIHNGAKHIYTVTGTTPCSDATATVTVKVNDLPNNYKNGGFKGGEICKGDNAKLIFKALAKGFTTPYKITYRIQGSTTEWEQEITEKGGFEFTVPVKPTQTTTYELVSISNPTCTRTTDFGTATATVEVIEPANAGTDGTLTICKGTTPTDDELFNALQGTPNTGGKWTSNGNIYTYTVTGKSACKATATATVTVTEVEPANAGIDGVLPICEGEVPTEEKLFQALEGNPTTGGTWTHNGTKHTYTVTGTTPCSDATATVTVKVNKYPNNGKTGGFTGMSICQGSDGTLTFDAIDGSFTAPYKIVYKVQDSTEEWTQEIAEKGKVSFTVPVKPTETTVYELVSISNATCTRTEDFGTATAEIKVVQPANAGTKGTLTVCKGITPTNDALFNALEGTPDAGGGWTHNGTEHIYTVKSKSPCRADATAIVKVIEVEPVSAGTDGVLPICEGETPTEEELFKALEGNPTAGGTWAHNGTKHIYTVKGIKSCADATATVTVKANDLPNNYKSGGFVGKPICQGSDAKLTFKALSKGFTTPYKIVYKVQGSTTEWTQEITEKGSFEFTVREKPMETTVYELVSISNTTCTRITGFGSATATIEVIEPANAGTKGTLTVCKGTTPTNEQLFKALKGTPDAGGDWTHNGTEYIYTVKSKSPCIADATATVTVTEVAPANAGTNGTLIVCKGETPTEEELFQALEGNPTAGGTWIHNGTKHIYTVKGTKPCADATATVTVKVNDLPNNYKSGGFTGKPICQGSDAKLTFKALSKGFTMPYKITYKVQGSTTEWEQEIAEKGKVSFTVPVKPTETTIYELVSISNATCTRTIGFGSATATIEVIEPANAGTKGILTVCKGTTPTNEQLFKALEGTPDTGGNWTHNGTEHIYTVKSKSPCIVDATAIVTVTEVDPVSAGTDTTLTICEGQTPTEEELFKALQGNPTAGGTWAHNGTKHIYTVKGTTPCADATATVTVKANDLPNNYKSGGFAGKPICQGSDAKLTFKALAKGFTTPYKIVYKVQGSTTEWTQEITEKGSFEFTVREKPIETTVYELVSISNATCTRTIGFGSATATIEVISPANAGINGRLTVCKGTTPTNEQLFKALKGTPNAGGNWTNVGNVYTYTVTATSPCTATATATVTVTEVAPANAGTNGTLIVCKGENPTNDELFNALGGTPNMGGKWTNEGNVYTYTVPAKSPCVSDATATVKIKREEISKPILSSYEKIVCTQNDKGNFTITNYNKEFTYVITPNAGVVLEGDEIRASKGIYEITVQNNGCTSSSVAFEVVVDSTLSNCDADNDGLTNEQENLLGTNPNSSDTDNDGISDLEEVETIENPIDTDEDSIIDALDSNILDTDLDGVVNQLDVDNEDPCLPKLSEKCNLKTIQINRGFSPNGDGINDKLVLPFLEKYPNNKLYIYTKTGRLVFKTAKYGVYNNYFEGITKGSRFGRKKLLPDVYFYLAEFYVDGELVRKTGWIYIKY